MKQLVNNYFKEAYLLIFVLCVSCQTGYPQEHRREYKALSSGSLVKDKNFYLLTLFDQIPALKRSITSNPVLAALKKHKLELLHKSAESCYENVSCHVENLRLSEKEINTVSKELGYLLKKDDSFQSLVQHHLRKSGMYEKYAGKTDDELLISAWKDAALAINRIMDVYALGIKPKYSVLDSASYDVQSPVYRKNINLVVRTMAEVPSGLNMFFDPALQFSLDLLELNMRNEAERFEPLDSINRKAIAHLAGIQWEKYPYSVILVPGAGPDIESAALDPWAISRLRIAVDRFKKGEAPLFILSGGFVKPFQTPYCEGMEMKKYLMSRFHIPEEYIVLEPFARHTTTNIRNAARLMLRYNIPSQKKALLITDWYQSKTIQSDPFRQRCLDELGYLPFVSLKARSPVDTEFTPAEISIHRDAGDPLDP